MARRTAALGVAALAACLGLAWYTSTAALAQFAGPPPSIVISGAGGNLRPGGPAAVETAVITPPQVGSLRLYVRRFVSRDEASSRLCAAVDPAAALEVGVRSAGRDLFEGSLETLARAHGSARTALLVPAGATSLTMEIRLSARAGNLYMGCRSDAELDWFTA